MNDGIDCDSRVTDRPALPQVWRERPVRGEFPHPGFLGLPGVDQIRHARRAGGPAPPFTYFLGVAPTEAEAGACAVAMPVTDWLQGSDGLVPGGAVALVADAALSLAVHTALPPATLYTTAELNLYLLRPVTPDAGRLTARARNVRMGTSVVVTDALVCDAEGRAVARASSRCYIPPKVDLPPGAEPPEWVDPGYEGPHPYQRPAAGAAVPMEDWLRRSGIEVLEAQRNGALPLPPIQALTGLQATGWVDGASEVVLPASPWLAATHGNVVGGAVCLLAESAIATAVSTTVPAGHGYAMLDLNIRFLRPAAADDTNLTARAHLLHRGRTTRVGTADVRNSAGKTVAVATGSALMLDSPFCREQLDAANDATL